MASVEFRLLRAQFLADTRLQMRKDALGVQQFAYLLSAIASKENAQGVQSAVDRVNKMLRTVTDIRLGQDKGEARVPEVSPEQRQKQIEFLEVLARQPFTTLQEFRSVLEDAQKQVEK